MPDLDLSHSKAIQYGASLDGEIRSTQDFKVGTFRAPDGVMFSLMELKEEAVGYVAPKTQDFLTTALQSTTQGI